MQQTRNTSNIVWKWQMYSYKHCAFEAAFEELIPSDAEI